MLKGCRHPERLGIARQPVRTRSGETSGSRARSTGTRGLLNNERYIGRISWSRSRWKRGAADSLKRISLLVEDRSEWVTRDEPHLRIIPEKLWSRVRARQAAAVAGAARVRAARTGRPAVSLLSGLLICESCGSRFIAVDRCFYGCASYKQGGLAACSNTARVKREHVEQVILAEIEAEILSDEAVAHAQKAVQDELRRLAKRDKPDPPVTPKFAKLDAEASELRAMLKTRRLSPAVAQAALDAIERERTELVSSVSRSERKAGADIIRVMPQSARLYREAVRNLNMTLAEPAERQEARALIAELLGGHVKVRQEGEAVYARLEMDAGVLLAAAVNYNKINYFQRGSGGVSWVSHTLDFVEVEMR